VEDSLGHISKPAEQKKVPTLQEEFEEAMQSILDPANGRSLGIFRMGDMQEHKYRNQRAWQPGAMPHSETKDVEDIAGIIVNHFDYGKQDFKSAWQIREEQEQAAIKAEEAALAKGPYEVPEHVTYDWSGTHFGKYWKTYGKEPESLAQKKHRGSEKVQLGDYKRNDELQEAMDSIYKPLGGKSLGIYRMGDMQEHRYKN